MIVVKHIFSVIKMTNWTRVYLNNLLSLIFQPFFFVLSKEFTKIPLKEDPGVLGLIYLILSSVLGVALAWSGTALRVRVTATTFTVVGVVCKIVTELVNVVMWDRHANQWGLLALLTCFIGSVLFVPSPPRSPESRFSNATWSTIDSLLCGALTRFELESPEFVKALDDEEKRAEEVKNAAQYEPVAKEDVEANVEMSENPKQ